MYPEEGAQFGLVDYDWKDMGSEQVTTLVEHQLGPHSLINPLFREERWTGSRTEGTLREQFLEVLLLASRMLTSAKSLDVLHQVLLSPHKRIDNDELRSRSGKLSNSDLGGAPYHKLGPLVQWEVGQHHRVEEALHRLAETLRFRFERLGIHGSTMPALISTPKVKESGDETTDPGYKASESNVKGIDILGLGKDHEQGVASVIRINKWYLDLLSQLMDRPGNNTNQILAVRTKMAMTICDDVIHACNFAVDRAQYLEVCYEQLRQRSKPSNEKDPLAVSKAVFGNEPFRASDDIAELGCYWENAVFGGRIEFKHEEPDHPLFFAKWPSFLTLDHYPILDCKVTQIEAFVVPVH